MKKTKPFVLLLAAALLFAGCDSAPADSESAKTDTGTQTVSQETKCLYTLIRSDKASSEEQKAAVRLRKTLEEEYNVEVVITTDWYNSRDKTAVERYDHEIVFGHTEREVSQALLAELHEGTQDTVDYIIRATDRDYVIGTSAGGAEAAVYAFLALVENDPSILFREPDASVSLSEKHVFPCPDYTLFGTPIADYTAIVYPSSYTSNQYKQFSGLQEDIFALSGVSLPFVKDTEAVSGAVIRIGAHDVPSLGDYGFAVKGSADGVSVTGVDFYTDLAAYDVLTEQIAAARDGLSDGYSEDYVKIWDTTEDTIHRAAWVISSSAMTSKEQFAEIAECGFDQIIMSRPSDAEQLGNYCKWMAEYGLQALWSDGSIAEGVADPVFSEYVYSPVTWGNMLRDEPSVSSFEALDKLDALYAEKAPGKVPFVNLFPNYANEQQLGCKSYAEYVKQYLSVVEPSYLSVDIYPMNVGGTVNDGYLTNLDEFSTPCREAGIPYALYIQSVSFAASKRGPKENEMRWQSYIGLAFGVTNIEYFTYRTPDSSTEDFKPALIDRENKKTEAWYGAQKVNAELAALGPVFAEYRNLGAFTVHPNGAYTKFQNQYDFSDTVTVTEENKRPVLVGAFEKKDGSGKAVTVVNLTDPEKDTEESVRLTFASGVPLTLYRAGVPEALSASADGSVTVALAAGEGVFITAG